MSSLGKEKLQRKGLVASRPHLNTEIIFADKILQPYICYLCRLDVGWQRHLNACQTSTHIGFKCLQLVVHPYHTPEVTNMSPKKLDYFNRKCIFQPLIFREHVSFPIVFQGRIHRRKSSFHSIRPKKIDPTSYHRKKSTTSTLPRKKLAAFFWQNKRILKKM